MTDDIRIITGDCRQVMATLADGSVNAIVTDPPYGTGQWLRPEKGLGRLPKAAHNKAAWDVWDTAWLEEARRVCSGPIAFFVPTLRVGDAIRYAEANGEAWRMMAWCKSDPMPMFTGQVAYGLEPVIVLRHKSAGGGWDWCEASTPRKGRDHDGTGHPHQKPLKVAHWLVEAISDPGDLVLDPFFGSGTTGVACLKTGRRFIGIEIDPDNVSVARQRLGETRPDAAWGQRSLFEEAPGQPVPA